MRQDEEGRQEEKEEKITALQEKITPLLFSLGRGYFAVVISNGVFSQVVTSQWM